MCKRSRPAKAPGSLHHHRGQTEVTFDLQGGNILEGRETMPEVLRLHPISHNPEGLLLTTDGQLKEQKWAF